MFPPETLSLLAVEPDHQKMTTLGWNPTPVTDWSLPAVTLLSRLNEPANAE